MATGKQRRARPDPASLFGLLLAAGGIFGGFMLEEGKPYQIMGLSAGLIVFGGCLGATLVSSPLRLVKGALVRLKDVFLVTGDDHLNLIETMVRYATQARKEGLVSLEHEASSVEDAFLQKSLLLAVDGADLQEINSMMELEIDVAEHRAEQEAKVFEVAGGYAPTIGIIGAVLGLIIVMGNIEDMKKVGDGIAAAFVATIYGVGSANVLFLPAATKIKLRAKGERERRELILAGVTAIVEGMNPKLIRTKLEAFVAEHERGRGEQVQK